MRFQDVIGLAEVKKNLAENASEGRVSHAQLFLGAEGGGNLPLAVAYAQYILCDARTEIDSCGACSSCLKVSKLIHPDVNFTFPFFASKENHIHTCKDVMETWRKSFIESPYLSTTHWYLALSGENKQGIINKEEGVEILHRMSLKAYEGKYKISIIWMPEQLNPSAANSLLKIIEEPPTQTLFLFVASKADDILPTILSRTQTILLRRNTEEEIANALIEKEKLDNETAFSIAAVSEGNYWHALLHMHHSDEEGYFGDYRKWMQICWMRKSNLLIDFAETTAAQGREKQKQLINYALFMFRQCLMYNYIGEKSVTVRGAEQVFVKNFSPFITEKNIISINNLMNNAHRDITRNANSKIVFLDVSLKMLALLKK